MSPRRPRCEWLQCGQGRTQRGHFADEERKRFLKRSLERLFVGAVFVHYAPPLLPSVSAPHRFDLYTLERNPLTPQLMAATQPASIDDSSPRSLRDALRWRRRYAPYYVPI